MTRHKIVTRWKQVQDWLGNPYRTASTFDDLGAYPVPGSGGFQGNDLCYCEIELDDPTTLENHADTIILHAVDVDEQGRETPRFVPSQAAAMAKLRALGMSQRDVDSLSNWSDRRKLAEEVKALVK